MLTYNICCSNLFFLRTLVHLKRQMTIFANYALAINFKLSFNTFDIATTFLFCVSFTNKCCMERLGKYFASSLISENTKKYTGLGVCAGTGQEIIHF